MLKIYNWQPKSEKVKQNK
ncbi:MAG: hypothetical protein MRECE_16c008 [Mycoplasmataceae bacterium CE_OT135]|nr:MAG: hypothetical protein MRECE_16c008 [Mycoplasmataceae bacterium CE_OT135]